jgi:hypothetical protein
VPIEYTLEKDGGAVIAQATGVINLESFMNLRKALIADENLRDPHNTLLDARNVSHIEITEEDLVEIAKGLTSGPKKLGANRLAIVARKEQAFDLGKKYRAVEKGVEENVVVFYNISVARTWLGLDE